MNLFRADSLQPKFKKNHPDFSFEQMFYDQGAKNICGIDEAGRGPLAGPVVAAAVILDPYNIPDGLNDSKKLSATKRESLFEEILQSSTVSIASVGAKTIDQINIRASSLLAMAMASKALEINPCHALIDGNALPEQMSCPATTIIKGDARSLSIAAASIVAKVSRDRLMVRMDKLYPGYGFSGHKGYPTKTHREALLHLGVCDLHRMTFGPVIAAKNNCAE